MLLNPEQGQALRVWDPGWQKRGLTLRGQDIRGGQGSGWAAMLELQMPVEGPAVYRTTDSGSTTPACKSPLWLSLHKNTRPPLLSSGARDTKLFVGAPILKKSLTQVTTFSLEASWSVDTKSLRTWNCPTFEELGCTLKSLVSRLGEDLLLNSRCNCFSLLLPADRNTRWNR